MTVSRCRLLLIALLALIGPAALAQERAFVQFSTIISESTDPGHPGWIDAYAIDNKITGPVPPAGGGAGGRATFDVYAFLKGFDATSPVLNLAMINGTHFATVSIEICRVGTPTQECYSRIELSDVLVSALTTSGSVCGASGSCTPSITESLTLNYRKIAWIYTPYSGGTAGTPVRRCFNIDTNASCP